MAKDSRQVDAITRRDTDFTQWYTDVCVKAELIGYTTVKGMFVLRPYGYAIWENIQKELDGRFKATGHENVSMPLFIPESLLQKEKDHIEGFAPECAWVTMGGNEKLEERLCVRPTSETLFCSHWADVVHSWRDLPKLYNQWCSVVRWEKTSRPFLRHREFLWQEGHTLHATPEEAIAETEQQLETYADLCENVLAMPVIRGCKTDKEKFAGAERTYTIECMMHDHTALQGGTSHYFGNGFPTAFDIAFSDKNNQLVHPYETSWGLSTRIIGGLIMTHGDDNGLVLPPRVAPIQTVVLPIAQHKEGVLDAARALADRLGAMGIRVKVDDSDQSAGWKFAQYEMKGVPLRVEIGPRDIEKNECVAARRDTGEKTVISLDTLEDSIRALMDDIHNNMYAMAKKNMEDNTFEAETVEEVKKIVDGKGGFVKTKWCGSTECENAMKERAGVTSRCVPFVQDGKTGVCPICGKQSVKTVIWGVAY
ncbi:MAG: proline--tRNA ligase [Oscillospiraceae bacterium]|nr:proline--tRNA ligase [Oscillospiraceae bacterium]